MKTICALFGACLLVLAMAVLITATAGPRRTAVAERRGSRTVVLQAAAGRRPAREGPAGSR